MVVFLRSLKNKSNCEYKDGSECGPWSNTGLSCIDSTVIGIE